METWLTVKDKAEAIVNEVARNSPKGSYWEQYRETAIFEPVTSDRDVLSLCADALNTAEEHADNLREYVAGLESEVAEYQRLSEELSRLKDYGPMDDVRFQRLQKWTEEHEGFTPYKLHKSEFILGYCKGVLKDSKPIPMPQHIKKAFEKFPNDVQFGFLDGREVAFSTHDLTDSSLIKSYTLSPKILKEYLINPNTNKPYSNQHLKKLETEHPRKKDND